ncbi:MAG TPA: ABC transporter ATP-binding protein [Candidatus Polarisedimenticolia bacterium]|nr:ABC transporter ATP-binding protein [Candidatus Polarisedimenticolia bacterium]
MIEVVNLCKTFHDRKKGDIPAVRDVSFTCPPGQVFGLLGRNGAGKTTTLRMLATILTPTSGTARIDGLDVVQRPGEVRKRIGYLSGDTKLYDRLTGRELLSYFGELAGMSGASIAGRIAELQVSFGLGDFLDKRVGKMSTGMKQRLSLARVVLHDPPVLIFDEPTSGLDVMGAREVIRIVRDLRSKGRTIIFSTHIMTEAEKICDEIAIIERGAILKTGTVAALRGANGGGTLEDVFVETVEAVTSDL